MSVKSKQWWQSGAGLLGLALVLIVGVFVLRSLPAWRLDFSEDKLFTLSEGTQSILDQLENDIELSFYFSEEATQELPQLRDYATRVRELLAEYELRGGGRVKFNVIDPEPFSEAEDDATQAGLQAVPSSPGGDNIFFGLVGTGSSGGDYASESEEAGDSAATTHQEIIEFFNPERERFLEYDVSQLVYRLANPKKTVVGVITSAPMFGGFDFASQRPNNAWLIVQQLRQLVDVRELEIETDVIDADVDVLMVIHPQELSDSTRYAIDQFILNGGKAIIAVDPHAELIAASQGMMGVPSVNSSDLSKLFTAWGVKYDPTKVVGDGRWALRVASGGRRLQLPHVGIIGVGESSLNREDIATSELETINFATAGYFTLADDAKVSMEPLVSSSDSAMPMAADRFVQLTDHGDLLKDFTPTGERYVLVARIRGQVPSAFPDGPPSVPDDEGEDADKEGGGESDDATAAAEQEGETEVADILPPHLSESKGNINVMLIADTDVFTDRLWVQVSNFFGQTVAAPWANNGDLISNAVESLAGSSELIGLRSRGTFARPFTVVKELELAAAERFQEQEQILVSKLDELERRIRELSQDDEGQLVLELNSEQQQEIQSFEEEKLKIRKELRQVQHQLNQDIDSLEARLKFYNIILVPGILTLILVALAVIKSRHRRIDAEKSFDNQ